MGNRFLKTNFIFKANRYEEWQGGACISRGSIDTTCGNASSVRPQSLLT